MSFDCPPEHSDEAVFPIDFPPYPGSESATQE
jgi:hypothetical protein